MSTYKEVRGSQPAAGVRQAEAERILKLVRPDDYLVACDERGRQQTTDDLCRFLAACRAAAAPLQGRSRAVIVIGGAVGLGEAVRQRADALWSLSGLVLAGGIARLVLLEALYRAATILDGHPYHNE